MAILKVRSSTLSFCFTDMQSFHFPVRSFDHIRFLRHIRHHAMYITKIWSDFLCTKLSFNSIFILLLGPCYELRCLPPRVLSQPSNSTCAVFLEKISSSSLVFSSSTGPTQLYNEGKNCRKRKKLPELFAKLNQDVEKKN